MARDIRKKTNGGYLTLDDKATKNTDLQAGNNILTPQDNAFKDNLTNAINNWQNNNPTTGGTTTGSGRWNNGNGNPLDNWWNNNGGNTTIKPGSYQNAYSGTINSLINQAINRQPFEWDPATDQAYQAYARMYTRLGEEAGRDTLADVASNTGGLASSYAVTASQQARGAYNQALTDKIPELMQLAYDRYRNQYLDLLSGIGTLQDVSNSLYGRYSDQRDFNEGVRQYNQNYELDKNAQEYERMLNMWTSLGYANSEVAKYFGVPEGTKTDESAYRWAQFALSQAGSGSSGGGGGGGRRTKSSGGGGGNSGNNSNIDPDTLEGTKNAQNYLSRLGGYLISQGNSLSAEDRMNQIIANLESAVKNGKLTKGEMAWILNQLYGGN
jgi:hypothetical protein